MPYYHLCEFCGSHLDPGEDCDCQDREVKKNADSNNHANETTIESHKSAYEPLYAGQRI